MNVFTFYNVFIHSNNSTFIVIQINIMFDKILTINCSLLKFQMRYYQLIDYIIQYFTDLESTIPIYNT